VSKPAAESSPSRADAKKVPPVEVNPLKPRRGLFAALCVVMALWVAALVVMYFTTVRGR
jgi:hypothetical protein